MHARDINSSTVCKADPDHVVATLDKRARSCWRVGVAVRGYVPAERNKTPGMIGTIPIDALFSPVRRSTTR